MARLISGLLGLAILTVAGCGGDDQATTSGGYDGSGVTQQPEAAADPSIDAFPDADGRTLRELAEEGSAGTQYATATTNYEQGQNRVAFGLVNDAGEILYAPSAIYIARKPGSPAKGPFLAPTDSLVTDSAFRSEAAALESDPFAAVYSAEVPLDGPGVWTALVLSDTEAGLVGATTRFEVAKETSVPDVGEVGPSTSTETVEDVGDITAIETRKPPDTMHETDLADVQGERPVALLFATPALCQSRVCGPVTDIAEQLKTEYGDQIEFIHQEVYVDNDPNKGLRPPLQRYGLRTEPWLFTLDAEGRVAARLEGSFGLREFEEAIQAAL